MVYLIIIAGILWILVSFQKLLDAIKVKRVKYTIKKIANSLFSFAVLIWIMYYYIGSTYLTVAIKVWALEKQSDIALSADSRLVLSAMPIIFVITMVFLSFVIIRVTGKGIVKYNQQELNWEREDRIKYRSQLPKILRRFIKIDELPRSS